MSQERKERIEWGQGNFLVPTVWDGDIPQGIEIVDIHPLAKGGFGEVYKANLKFLSATRPVAIKTVSIPHAAYGDLSSYQQPQRDQLEYQRSQADQLHDEYLIQRELNKHNVGINTQGYIEANLADKRLLMMVMEYVEGKTLHEEMVRRGGQMDQAERSYVIREVLSQLAVAHKLFGNHGIVHRDIKPGNIMLRKAQNGDNGSLQKRQVILMDFNGAVNPRELASRIWQEQGFGTPAYLAPEQIDTIAQIGTPTDVFAAAIVFSELFLGESHAKFLERRLGLNDEDFNTGSNLGRLAAYLRTDHLADMVTDLQLKFVHPFYIDWLMKAFQPDPNNRFTDAEDMLKSFDWIQEGLSRR